jgi:hypothetical protein
MIDLVTMYVCICSDCSWLFQRTQGFSEPRQYFSRIPKTGAGTSHCPMDFQESKNWFSISPIVDLHIQVQFQMITFFQTE